MRHPLHPLIIHFPIVCWSLVTTGDLANRFLDTGMSRPIGILLITGCITGVIAMIAGLFELVRVKKRDEIEKTVDLHMNAAILAWCLYTTSLFLRWDNGFVTTTGNWTLLTSTTGFVCLIVTGWFGGKLVYQFGVGTRLEQNQ